MEFLTGDVPCAIPVTFLDSDLILMPESAEKAHCFGANGKVGLIFCRVEQGMVFVEEQDALAA